MGGWQQMELDDALSNLILDNTVRFSQVILVLTCHRVHIR
jgi:hypothetical protein